MKFPFSKESHLENLRVQAPSKLNKWTGSSQKSFLMFFNYRHVRKQKNLILEIISSTSSPICILQKCQKLRTLLYCANDVIFGLWYIKIRRKNSLSISVPLKLLKNKKLLAYNAIKADDKSWLSRRHCFPLNSATAEHMILSTQTHTPKCEGIFS